MADVCATGKREWVRRGRFGGVGAWIAALVVIVVLAVLVFGAAAVFGWLHAP